MTDQLYIGGKASYDDFCASLAKRNIGLPAKKSIKETVPYSNLTYDFSKINGELYWGERELEYTFELIASTPEKLEELKTAFSNWVMNVHEADIQDPFIPDYHFVGTYDAIKFEDEETLDKTTVTVTFTAYPYKIANVPDIFECYIDYEASYLIEVVNTSGHQVRATATCVYEGDGKQYVTLALASDNKAITGFSSNEKGKVFEFNLPAGAFTFKAVSSYLTPCRVYICVYSEVL